MRFAAASLICASALVGAAPAFADDTATNSTSMTNPRAVHKKLMQDCMQQQKSQNSTASDADVHKSCEQQVKDQMQRMNDAGTLPKSAVPGQSGSQSGSQSNSDADYGTQPKSQPQ